MNPINAERYRERLRWGEESVAAHMHTQRLALLESQTVVEAKEVLYESWAIHKRAIVFTSSINMVCYLGRLILKRC